MQNVKKKYQLSCEKSAPASRHFLCFCLGAPAARHFISFSLWGAPAARHFLSFPLRARLRRVNAHPGGPIFLRENPKGPPPTKNFLGLLPWIYAKNVVARGPPLATSPGAVGGAPPQQTPKNGGGPPPDITTSGSLKCLLK